MTLNASSKIRVVWVQGLTCNGNSHSFLNYPHYTSLLSSVEILYHPLLPSPYTLKTLVKEAIAFDVLIIEGALSKDETVISRHGMGMDEILNSLLLRSAHVVCVGSCAAFGGIFREYNPSTITGGMYAGEKEAGFWSPQELLDKGKVLINIPGCPAHPSWIAETLLLLRDAQSCAVDALHRPREVYAYLAHHGCVRNEYFEWKIDCEGFGTKEGCLFYEQGCQGPMTHASCNKVLWNETSSKTRVGSPCFGCTEPTFPKQNLFLTQKYMSLPAAPIGVPRRAYYALAGVAKGFKIERLEKRLMHEED